MIVNRETIAALDREFRVIYGQTLDRTPSRIGEIATVVPSAGASTDFPLAALTGRMREWIDDRKIQNLAAWTKNIVNKTWEQAVGVKREHIEDDQIGVYSPAIQQLAAVGQLEDYRRLIETVFGVQAFSSDYPGYDAVAFFSAAHTWPGAYAPAQDNVTDEVLDSAAIYTGISAMASFRGPDGHLLLAQPTHFLASETLRATVDGLFTAQRLANGEDNPHFGRFPRERIIIDPGIPSGYWAMLDCSKPVKPFLKLNRRSLALTAKIDLNDDNVFFQNQFVWGTDARWEVAALAWWLAYGSNGSET